MRYKDGSDYELQYCDGDVWKPVGVAPTKYELGGMYTTSRGGGDCYIGNPNVLDKDDKPLCACPAGYVVNLVYQDPVGRRGDIHFCGKEN